MRFREPPATAPAPAQWFTGQVWFDPICSGEEPSRVRVNLGRFTPGARTFWHRHVLGQVLHVVSGVALVGTRDGTVFEAHPGETVLCPPGEEHWHGAAPDRFMEHIAIWEGDGGAEPETTWLEEVTAEQYAAARTRRHESR